MHVYPQDRFPHWDKNTEVRLMWTSKQPQTDLPVRATPPGPGSPVKSNELPPTRLSSPNARDVACLGPNLVIKADISGSEDLQIDGAVEGAIRLENQRLTVGRTAHLKSEILAGEVVIYGKVEGNLRVRDRVEIRKDGSLTGDITPPRISIYHTPHFNASTPI